MIFPRPLLACNTPKLLPDKPNLVDAVEKFIGVNAEMWEGQDPTEYLDSIREKHDEE